MMGFLYGIFVNGERSPLSNRCRHGGAVPVPFMGPDLDTGTFTFTFYVLALSAGPDRCGRQQPWRLLWGGTRRSGTHSKRLAGRLATGKAATLFLYVRRGARPGRAALPGWPAGACWREGPGGAPALSLGSPRRTGGEPLAASVTQ